MQTVNRQQNSQYYTLIQTFGEMTGVPVLLTTSFNMGGTPLVEANDDAIKMLFASGLDPLIIGTFLIIKRYPYAKLNGR